MNNVNTLDGGDMTAKGFDVSNEIDAAWAPFQLDFAANFGYHSNDPNHTSQAGI